MRMKFVALCVLALSSPTLLFADDITLTTTYPSPRGVYKELRATNNVFLATLAGAVSIGAAGPPVGPAPRFVIAGSSDPAIITCPAGYDHYDENQNGLVDAGECKRTLLIALLGGNVGIGTANPQAKLDVAGKMRIVDGTEGVGKVLISDANGMASWGSAGVTPCFWSGVEFTAGASCEVGPACNVFSTIETCQADGAWSSTPDPGCASGGSRPSTCP